MASYPTSTPSFPTLVNGVDTVDASHPNNMATEIVAIAADLRAGLPIARGGTGATTASAAIAALFAGGQLPFPASQNASSNANTLDDYEEGTWTPVIGGSGGTSGQTYSARSAYYVKVGRLVLVSFRAILSNKGTITTNVQIQGLPFTATNSSGGVGVGGLTIQYFNGMNTNWIALSADIGDNTTVATVYGTSAAAASVSTLAAGDISNTTDLRGFGWYIAAS